MDIPEEVIQWDVIRPSKIRKRPPADAWNTGKIKETSYERTMKPLYTIMKIIGALPIVQDQHGVHPAKLTSPLVCYSVIIYSIQFVNSVLAIIRRVNDSKDWLMKCGYVVFYLQYLLIPFKFWITLPNLCSHISRVHKFHKNFQTVAGHDLDNGFEKITRYMVVVVGLISVSLSWLWVYGDLPDELWSTYIHFLPVGLNLSYDIIFCLSCGLMGIAASNILSELKERLQDLVNGDRIVGEYRFLWLELSHVLQSQNQVNSVAFSYHVTHTFALLTLTMYNFLNGLYYEWHTQQSSFLIVTFMLTFELWTLAVAAEYVSNKFEGILWDHFLLIPDKKMPQPIIDELSAFLDIAESCPRSVNIGGYLNINKRWIVNMLGSLLSSLVILIQFQIANDDCSLSYGLTTNVTSI